MTEGGVNQSGSRERVARRRTHIHTWLKCDRTRSRLAWSTLFGVVTAVALVFSPTVGAPWPVVAFVGLGATLLPLFGPEMHEPNRNRQGQFAPALRRQWVDVVGAVVLAVLFEWVLFASLLGNVETVENPWSWPWQQVHDLNIGQESQVQPALALLTPVGALVTAVFAYRKSTIALAESQRADVAAFQQRFIDAAKLMADANASTRIAGATAMGSLARDWVDNRQECVNVLCGYLKVRPGPEHMEEADNDGTTTYTWKAGEDEVRLEVVDQLCAVLTPGPGVPVSAVPIDLKLSRAWFPPAARLDGATFTGDASFDGATFTGDASFNRATFTGDAFFYGATFTGKAFFHGATFTGNAFFHGATFTGSAFFYGATFTGHASFNGATFTGNAFFNRATFTDPTQFDGATFTASVEDAEGTHERGALGPLGEGSTLPDPPGSIVAEDGTTAGDVEWTREEPEE